MISINCKGKLLSLEKPIAMGILNTTPDSFFDGGKFVAENKIAAQAAKLLTEGASIIDIGGMSSKPGSKIISVDEELNRVLPAIDIVLETNPEAIISIDTIHAKVAEKAVAKGASIVNDISAGNYDAQMLSTVAEMGVPYIAMHMKGIPENMMQNADYDNVVLEVFDFLAERIVACAKVGIKDVIIDLGFGFSKTLEQNYLLLKNMNVFASLGKPVLAGLSRKSIANKLLGISAVEALNATTALNTLALTQGAKILRVHDVKEAVEAIKIFEAYEKAQ